MNAQLSKVFRDDSLGPVRRSWPGVFIGFWSTVCNEHKGCLSLKLQGHELGSSTQKWSPLMATASLVMIV